ncbi:MAG: metallophosphoesterase [Bacteroidales bacterium]|nr:metallophosphoesterase [Bacteroidales bacterium]
MKIQNQLPKHVKEGHGSNKNKPVLLFLTLAVAMLASCTATKPWYGKDVQEPNQKQAYERQADYRLVLVGDQGAPDLEGKDPVLEMLTQVVNQGQDKDIVFLGDNIYQNGMETEPPEAKILAEKKISKTLSSIQGFGGNVYFIAGNHDWLLGHKNLVAQEDFLSSYPGHANIRLLPKAGCPGPEVVNLNDRMLLVLMDSEWFLEEDNENIAKNNHCSPALWKDAIDTLRIIAETNVDKILILAVHHPLYTQGKHGGFFSWKQHLFPLTEINKSLWLPLPLIGSLYPMFRKMGVSNQDVSGPLYRKYRQDISEAVSCHPNVIITSGHEHNLQYFYQKGLHQIVSGSGSKITPVKKGGKAQFASSSKGFATLDMFDNKEIILSYWHVNDTDKPVYRTPLINLDNQIFSDIINDNTNFPDTITIITDSIYEKGKTGRFFWGEHYRDIWSAPQKYNVLKLNETHGGLKIYRAGGGFQTTTLFVKDTQNIRYVIRTIRKDPTEVLPEALQQTFSEKIIQDQISASHPFGAAVVPTLSSAAGIYFNIPEYYYLPDDPHLGQYRKRARNQPVLLEEFISPDYLKEKFGHDVQKVISTEELMETLLENNHHFVDMEWYWRTKLVDMLLNDWDRHEGQYFWVAIAQNESISYRPFPIDRDNVMFKMDGLIPSMVTRKWNLPQFQNFDPDIKLIEGMNFQSMHMDRRFLAGLEHSEWHRIAARLQQSITDSIITEAVSRLPVSGPVEKQHIVSLLKSRRDKLTEFAERYYEVVARQLEIVGTKQDEVFVIETDKKNNLKLSIYAGSVSKNPYFERTINQEETKEIRIYGIDGNDRVVFKNLKHRQKIRFELVPGKGNMHISDEENLSSKAVLKMHQKEVKNIEDAVRKDNMSEFTQKTLQQFGYNYTEHTLGYVAPVISFGFNSYDGAYLGGGIIWKKPGFRKYPYAAVHKVVANIAPLNASFNFYYKAEFTNLIAGNDFLINATVYSPNNSTKFYGFGNDSVDTGPSKYYNVRRDIYEINFLLRMNLTKNNHLVFGPSFQITDVRKEKDKFYTTKMAGLSDSDFNAFTLPGLQLQYLFNNTNDSHYPTKGIKIKFVSKWWYNIQDQNVLFRSNLSLGIYQKIPHTGFTIASRIGGMVNIGSYRFFQANVLGGAGLFYNPDKDFFEEANFRGAPADRFSGTAVFYHNTDLRLKIWDVQSYVIPGQFGAHLLFDYGKIWLKDSAINSWQYGWGGGLWYNFYGNFLMNLSYGHSVYGSSFQLLTSFLF